MNEYRKFIFPLFAIILCIVLSFLITAQSESILPSVYCIADRLNGRQFPSTQSAIEARFEYAEDMEVTSLYEQGFNNGWIQIKAGECGTVWCRYEYLTEIIEPFYVVNDSGGRVAARKYPSSDSKLLAWIRSNKEVKITQVLYGFGKTSKGWVDLSYFSEIE